MSLKWTIIILVRARTSRSIYCIYFAKYYKADIDVDADIGSVIILKKGADMYSGQFVFLHNGKNWYPNALHMDSAYENVCATEAEIRYLFCFCLVPTQAQFRFQLLCFKKPNCERSSRTGGSLL